MGEDRVRGEGGWGERGPEGSRGDETRVRRYIATRVLYVHV